MSAERITRAVSAAGWIAALVLSVGVTAGHAALEIRHFDGSRYDVELTRGYEQCVTPNDVSAGGIDACSPPVTSACEFQRGDVDVRPFRDTPSIDVNVRLTNVSGPGSCTTGSYHAVFNVRVTADDAACATGQCTWIDAPIHVPMTPHSTDDFEINHLDLESYMQGSYGIAPSHVANYEILGVSIIAPDGLTMAAVGVGNNHSANSFRSVVSARYAPCTTPDTSSTSGVPACGGPIWSANCDFTAGQIRYKYAGGRASASGSFIDTSGASPLCANGAYEITSLIRATGPLCAGACTLVDTPSVVTVPAVDGVISALDDTALDSVAFGAADSLEILESSVRNPLGEVYASPAVTNAFVLGRLSVRIAFKDPANPNDDRLSVRGAFPHPPIDPTVAGATFTVTDQNGPIYSVAVPAAGWTVVRANKWQYKDDLGTIGGVRRASIKEYKVGATPAGFKMRLKAQDLSLSAADLPTENVVVSVGNTTSGTSHGMQNAYCRLKASGVRCHL